MILGQNSASTQSANSTSLRRRNGHYLSYVSLASTLHKNLPQTAYVQSGKKADGSLSTRPYPRGGGGTWPMFGYRGAAEGLKSGPCLGQGYAKNPTLCRTTASISRPCLGQVTKCTLSGLHEFKLFNKSFKSEKSCSMHLKPSCILMTL